MPGGRAGVRHGAALLAVLACLASTGCQGTAGEDTIRGADGPTASVAGGDASPDAEPEPGSPGDPGSPGGTDGADGADGAGGASAGEVSVPDPGPLARPLHRADVLVTSTRPIPSADRKRIARIRGVRAAMPLSLAALSSNGRTLTIAAADPAGFRRFTPQTSAEADDVWSRVAGGEVAVDPSLGRRLEEPKGYLRLGTQQDAPQVHIGAYAPLVTQFGSDRSSISAVVNRPRGDQIGMPRNNALLVDTGDLTPSVLTGRMKRILGGNATIQVLALEFDVDVPQTAVLTGTSAADAVGSFSYVAHPSGRVTPDPAWVAANIRTRTVPLLGPVTCHRVMLPQLRAALQEIVRRGLAAKIHPGEYAGCYYPRFIGYDPAKGLSLHSWGIAVDLNTPGNQRGTAGEMDRTVVAIFKKWGFAWGGDWNYTDPMHFELSSIVETG